MSRRYEGRRVLVTGAAAGLGRSFAERFAAEGAELILLDRDEQGLRETAAALAGPSSMHGIDLADEAAAQRLGAEICARHGQLHVLVNNAGIAYGEITQGFETLPQQKWLQFLAVNTIAPLILAQALRPALAAAHGRVLNISSMAAYMPATPYGVTKAALNAITYGMAQVFAGDGIRVNAIAPGLMETTGSRGLPPEAYARVQAMQLLKQHGNTEDIASLALFLASDEARFIDGEIIHCDAGNRIRGWRY